MGRLGFFGLLIFVLGCTPKTSHSPSFDAGAVEQFREQTAALREGSSHRLMLEVMANSTVLREFQAMDSSVRNGIREVLFEEGLQSENDLGLWIENTSLIHLRVRKTALSDVGFAFLLPHQHQLRILNVPDVRWTGATWKKLPEFSELTMLRIGGAAIDDQAIEFIATIPRLESLHLIGPRITARSLELLAKAEHLHSLYVDDCPLPDEAWLKLFEVKPRIHVHIDQAHHDRDPAKH
ncbi:MAG: hypothetical protein U0905_04390 [Pirellulales bacterium]